MNQTNEDNFDSPEQAYTDEVPTYFCYFFLINLALRDFILAKFFQTHSFMNQYNYW